MKIPEIPEAYRPSQMQVHLPKTSADAHMTREYLRQVTEVVRLQQTLIESLQNRIAALENPMYTPTSEAGENPVAAAVEAKPKSKK